MKENLYDCSLSLSNVDRNNVIFQFQPTPVLPYLQYFSFSEWFSFKKELEMVKFRFPTFSMDSVPRLLATKMPKDDAELIAFLDKTLKPTNAVEKQMLLDAAAFTPMVHGEHTAPCDPQSHRHRPSGTCDVWAALSYTPTGHIPAQSASVFALAFSTHRTGCRGDLSGLRFLVSNQFNFF
ncbi:hypothetical protein PAPYR_6693 [Paratrimastix pyriformis]|uniref:Uncharacterized protein n=1 Tax=Paratrimastix pyriformis TaxID=342808 RepID=A0ABQ8UG64_9EUKA|nr:hypothetical protein PAPYR_6693 [Paratrimastix pyriformis]